jgi:DNA-binding transcriptional MerR regulator
MTDNELLAIGQFARLAGLTVHALRHYDAVGLLEPATVDPGSGYRRYTREQLTTARLIRDLRWLSVSLADVRGIIADPASTHATALLEAQARRLARERDHSSAGSRSSMRTRPKE